MQEQDLVLRHGTGQHDSSIGQGWALSGDGGDPLRIAAGASTGTLAPTTFPVLLMWPLEAQRAADISAVAVRTGATVTTVGGLGDGRCTVGLAVRGLSSDDLRALGRLTSAAHTWLIRDESAWAAAAAE